jgi:Cu-processing system permease protein
MLRSRWMQLVALLFVFVFASVSLIQQMALPEVEGFTRQSAAALNLQLFLFPLFLLTIGSMSIAGDVESGWLSLLKTYPITLRQYVFGKYAALLLSFFVMLALSFSVVIGTGALVGQLGISWVLVVLSFLIVFIFAAIALLIGAIAKSRLHALALSLVLWASWLLLLSYALMAIGTFSAGHVLQKLMIVNIHINPAEWLRFGYFLLSKQEAVLGPAFYSFTSFYSSPFGLFVYACLSVLWITLSLGFAVFILDRKGRVE